MTDTADEDDQPPTRDQPKPKPALIGAYAPLVAVIVAALAVSAAAYVAIDDEPSATRSPTATGAPAQTPPRVTARFDLGYPAERGPFEQRWQWMGNSGNVLTTGDGRYHLAFRALSISGPRRVTVAGAGVVTVHDLPRTYIVGPVRIGRQPLQLRAQPGAQRISARDRRRVSVFLSDALLVPQSVAALPGKGFYPTETLRNGASFRWLRDDGVVDVVSGQTGPGQAWVTLSLRSAVSRRVTASVVGGRSVGPLALEAERLTRMVVGPVPISGGRGRFRLNLTPGPARIDGDRRLLGALIQNIAASMRPPDP